MEGLDVDVPNSHRVHVPHIYLHLAFFLNGRCREIYHTWIVRVSKMDDYYIGSLFVWGAECLRHPTIAAEVFLFDSYVLGVQTYILRRTISWIVFVAFADAFYHANKSHH